MNQKKILIGALLGNAFPRLSQRACREGLTLVQKRFLRTGVALYGFNLSVQQILQVGKSGVLVDVLMVTSTLLCGWFVGTRLTHDTRDASTAVSASTAAASPMAPERMTNGMTMPRWRTSSQASSQTWWRGSGSGAENLRYEQLTYPHDEAVYLQCYRDA